MAAEDSLKTKHSVNPPVLTVCLLLRQYFDWRVFFFCFFYVNLWNIWSYCSQVWQAGPLCWTLENVWCWIDFGHFYLHSPMHSAVGVQYEWKQGGDWKDKHTTGRQFHVCFVCGKSLTAVFNFNFKHFLYSCTNRGFTAHNYKAGILALTESLCCASAIGEACICSFAISAPYCLRLARKHPQTQVIYSGPHAACTHLSFI